MTRALVVAKAPMPGRVKTRLGADVGMAAAADLAAAALLDTLLACADAFGADRCLLSLDGDLCDAVRGEEIERAKYYPEDAEFLLEYEPRVVHYEVVGKS